MKLSTGKVAFQIDFDGEDKEVIYFNPTDPDLMIRMKNFDARVQERTRDIEDVELSNDGLPTQISQIDEFEKMQKILKEELDYVFGGSVSEVVFKHCSPFAKFNGEFFIEQFIREITPEIINEIEKANAEMNKRTSKHIDKYKK